MQHIPMYLSLLKSGEWGGQAREPRGWNKIRGLAVNFDLTGKSKYTITLTVWRLKFM
jgi:hypothetical protein